MANRCATRCSAAGDMRSAEDDGTGAGTCPPKRAGRGRSRPSESAVAGSMSPRALLPNADEVAVSDLRAIHAADPRARPLGVRLRDDAGAPAHTAALSGPPWSGCRGGRMRRAVTAKAKLSTAFTGPAPRRLGRSLGVRWGRRRASARVFVQDLQRIRRPRAATLAAMHAEAKVADGVTAWAP